MANITDIFAFVAHLQRIIVIAALLLHILERVDVVV